MSERVFIVVLYLTPHIFRYFLNKKMHGNKQNSEKKMWVLLLWKKKPRETYILEKQYVKYYKNRDYVSAKWGKSWWEADVIEESGKFDI